MTQQEEQLLEGLVQRVQQTQLPDKDAGAEQMLGQTLGRNPDALYILCQTVLVQQYALDQAQKQLADARQQVEQLQQAQPEKHTSFLGNLFGGGQDQQPPRPQPPQGQYAPPQGQQGGWSPVQQGYGPPQPGYGPGYPPPQYAQQYPPQQPGMFGGGGGGFLQGAMQTAAGVAAGALAFQGIESLMHGFGHEAGYGSDRAMGFDDRPEVVNNYYGDDRGAEHSGQDGFGDRLQAADGAGSGLSPDVEDRRNEQGFFGGSDDNSGDALAADGGGDQFSDDLQDGGDDFGSGDDGGFDSGNDDNS